MNLFFTEGCNVEVRHLSHMDKRKQHIFLLSHRCAGLIHHLGTVGYLGVHSRLKAMLCIIGYLRMIFIRIFFPLWEIFWEIKEQCTWSIYLDEHVVHQDIFLLWLTLVFENGLECYGGYGQLEFVYNAFYLVEEFPFDPLEIYYNVRRKLLKLAWSIIQIQYSKEKMSRFT